MACRARRARVGPRASRKLRTAFKGLYRRKAAGMSDEALSLSAAAPSLLHITAAHSRRSASYTTLWTLQAHGGQPESGPSVGGVQYILRSSSLRLLEW